eukprot:TRINITY_DN7937_c0_g1_i1.p1 TRINITY_DN7937_c0_g1~~TRINITY_DN7937_c0_g1_i1.p1  ORF type:complete len:208 (+),score=45.62 TRINITY_DN7937_c0_g1_i1:114-737(+)
MGLKSARSKQARKELKKTLRNVEQCPHCKKKFPNLDQHILNEHSWSCARCGTRFTNEQAWKHHMRDVHGLDTKQAAKEDRQKKLEKWVNNSKQNSRKKDLRNAVDEDVDGMEATSCIPCPPTLHRHVCELCGTAVELAVDLSAQGLSFNCAFMGRPCNLSGSSGARPQAAPLPPIPTFSAPMPGAGFQATSNAAIGMAVPDDDDEDL